MAKKIKTQKYSKSMPLFVLTALVMLAYLVISQVFPNANSRFAGGNVKAADVNGFDQYGYNNTARIFNGTGSSWCQAKGMSADCMGIYSPDKLVMKWNAEWDRGNAENWAKPPYKAWTDNEWNGKVKNGSGAVWHYKIVWVGSCGADYTPLANGGYCIWGQFETVMDQGQDPNIGPGHIWFARVTPNGYGAYYQK